MWQFGARGRLDRRHDTDFLRGFFYCHARKFLGIYKNIVHVCVFNILEEGKKGEVANTLWCLHLSFSEQQPRINLWI